VKLAYFNYSSNVIPLLREVHTILPCIAFSKGPASYSTYFGAVYRLIEGDILEKDLKKLAGMMYDLVKQREGEQEARHTYDTIMLVHKVRQKKMPTKKEVAVRISGKGLINKALDLVRTHFRDQIIAHEMHRVNAFLRDELLKYYFANIGDGVTDTLNEEAVSEFMDIVAEDEFTMMPVCTEQVAHTFPMAGIEASLPSHWFEKGMLKLPMFEIPGFLQFKRKKYELMREEMRPELEGWWNALEQVAPAIAEVPFSAEYLPILKEKVMSSLAPVGDALSKRMRSSIYLQQLSNDEYGEYGSTFSFVMTRRMTLLEAFHKAGQLPGDALQKLDEYFTGRNTADNTVCFLLHELPSFPPKKKYFEKDEKWLDETWQQSMTE
jgi:hypothetical protein